MKAKQVLTIDALLDWAYRVQCVDRRAQRAKARGRPAGYPGASATAQFEMLGTKVDTSGFTVLDPTDVRTDDAMIIHDHVLRVPEVWLEWRGREEVELWTQARADQSGMVIERDAGLWQLFPRVSRGDASQQGVDLELVGTTVLLIQQARAGVCPCWHEGHVFRRGVKPQDDSCRRSLGRARSPRHGYSDAEVMHGRAIYAAWHLVLCDLTHALRGILQGFEVVPPAVRAAPWLKGTKTPRVLKTASSANCFLGVRS
jgi:hypothetical protein